MLSVFTWLIPWEPSPTVVISMAAAACLYVRGGRVRHVPPGRQLLFWTGLVLLYVALHTRLDYYAEHAFFVHRIQHLLLHHLGPFLIAASYPGPTLYAGIPLAWRRRWIRPFLAWRPVRKGLDVLLHPVVAAVLFVGLIYFWLIPAVHFDAMLDVRLYRVMNWSMAIDGLIFWWLVLDRRPAPPARLAAGMRILLIVAVIPPQILLGAILGLSPREFYTVYSICGRAFTHISPIVDQHLGGLILWIPGAMMSLIGALVALRHWMQLDGRGRGKRAAQLAAEADTAHVPR